MLTILIIAQIVLAFILVTIILLQKGKGAEMGVSFGAGASDTLFGSSGPMSFMAKLTWGLSFLFMLNSAGISYMIYNSNTASMIKNTPTATKQQSAVEVKIPTKAKPKNTNGAPITK